jgi:DNA-binding MarR family transcriptional regulator
MTRAPRQDGLFEPNLFLQFFLAGQPLGRLIERAIAPSGMKANEYAVMSAVDELEPVMPSDIARLTGMPRPTLTAHIERLVLDGYVERVQNPHDGRSYMLTLTPRGRRVKDENGRGLLTAFRELMAHLEDDPDELTAALGRLRAAAEAALDINRDRYEESGAREAGQPHEADL